MVEWHIRQARWGHSHVMQCLLSQMAPKVHPMPRAATLTCVRQAATMYRSPLSYSGLTWVPDLFIFMIVIIVPIIIVAVVVIIV